MPDYIEIIMEITFLIVDPRFQADTRLTTCLIQSVTQLFSSNTIIG